MDPSDNPPAPPTYADPDLAAPGAGPESSAGAPIDPDDLLAALEAEADNPIVHTMDALEVEGRAGWAVEYDPNISGPELESWQQRSLRGAGNDRRVDQLAYACIIVANCARGLLRRGQRVVGQDGAALTFASKRMQAMYGAVDAKGAVRKFLGDPQATAHADAILKAAGWGDTARPMDPTLASGS